MKALRLRLLLAASAFLAPVLALAHPGHDGDHDFEWDFDHLAGHPLATILCVAVLGAAAWGVWKLVQRPSAAPRAARRDDRR